MKFTHLHVHTEYSLLDGSNKINEYVARVKELGMDSAAITDHGVMFGCIDFYKAAKAAGIKPILGCEVYVAPGSRFDKEMGKEENRYYHLVLLAENQEGYQNLIKIVSLGFVDGFYYKPRVDKEILEKYHEGIIALSACLAGEVARTVTRGFYEEAKAAALSYEKIFGKGNFFLELQDHGIPEQKHVNQQLLRMSRETGIQLVVTNDVHYTYDTDAEAHDILLCVQTGKRLQDEDRMRYEGGQYYVKSPEEMQELFPYIPEALENTHKIAERCKVEIEFGVTKLPKFDVPKGYTAWKYLNRLCFEGLQERYPECTEDLKERLNYELGVIKNMGYVDYFLIVWDYVNFAKVHDCAVGPGRGSAAGSLVSYCLTITDIDPMKYNLLFERFLNPERVTMPDIDVDFSDNDRQKVIEYVISKYGKDCVSQIITFGTMAARAVIKDVGRVLDLPYAMVDNIAKMVPRELNITIDKAIQENPDLKELYQNDPQVKDLIEKSKKLEGLPRHASIHASGVLISGKPVGEYVPLSIGADGEIVAQFEKDTLEELGLLKMDFLGLRTETVLSDAEALVRKKNPEFSISKISYEDPEVYELISSGKCDGVFQLESGGMKNFMKELKPTCLDDIIAGISLYRPGPMDYIPQYVEGKKNKDNIQYDCPQLEPILKPTYGVIVYQEQVMQIVRDLAGYSLGRSDLVRRAMAKKKLKVMEKERQNFIYGNEEEGIPGCIKNGVSAEVGNLIFDKMMSFAAYAFNKSHAAGYAVVCYQTAFLKRHYPVEYMCALLTSVSDNTSKVEGYIYACRQMNIPILPPDVNESYMGFTTEENSIRFGFSAIKALGRPVIEAVIADRQQNGRFGSMQDFIGRLYTSLNKRIVENLIKAGAMDTFGANRRQMMGVYSQILDNEVKQGKDAISGQMSLFDIVDDSAKSEFQIKMPDLDEFNKEEKLEYEKEVLGVYVSGHPLDEYAGMWRKHVTANSQDFEIDDELGETKVADGSKQTIGGMIMNKKIMTTKRSELMAILTIEDLFGTVEVVVFPKSFANNRGAIDGNDKIFITGRVQANADENGRLICESITPFSQVPRVLWIRMEDEAMYKEKAPQLEEMLKDSDGRDSVIVYCTKENKRYKWPDSKNICVTSQLIDDLRKIYGEKNIETT